jgi:hypothetical protein
VRSIRTSSNNRNDVFFLGGRHARVEVGFPGAIP